jgi:hypothetical protein
MSRPDLSKVPILRSNVPPLIPPYNVNDYYPTSPNNVYSTLAPYKPYDPILENTGYASLELANRQQPFTTKTYRPQMPLPQQQSPIYGNIGPNRVNLSTNQYMNTGGRRLRKTTRRHRKTKHCRRLHKKKSKKSKKRT